MLACRRNGCLIADESKAGMNAPGAYAALGQGVGIGGAIIGSLAPSETASFWVYRLCSPFRSFGDRVAAYVEAVQSGDQEKVQTVNKPFSSVALLANELLAKNGPAICQANVDLCSLITPFNNERGPGRWTRHRTYS